MAAEHTCEQRHHSLPSHSQVLRSSKDQDLERSIDRIDTMIKQFSKRTTLMSSSSAMTPYQHSLLHNPSPSSTPGIKTKDLKNSRLRPINSIKSLIQKQPHGPRRIHPRRTILIQRRVIPQQRQQINHHEHEPRQRDQVRRHRHGEAFYRDVAVEGFEHVAGEKGVVDA